VPGHRAQTRRPGGDVFSRRRERLTRRLQEATRGRIGGALFFSGADHALAPFSPDPTFFYLTGVAVPGAAYLLSLTPQKARELLLLPPADPAKERWTGKGLHSGGLTPSAEPDSERLKALERTGHDAISPNYQLEECLARLLRDADFLYLDLPADGLLGPTTQAQEWAGRLRDRFPALEIRDAGRVSADLRRVKDGPEIEKMRAATSITAEAHRAVAKLLRPGLREYELRAAVEYVFTSRGALSCAFPTIVGAGPNSCVLHYDAGERLLEEGDLVVCDIGCRKDFYCADVTRTYPVSGKFTKRQAEVYRVVLGAQAAAIAAAKPGAYVRDLHAAASEHIERAGFSKFFFHGTSHYLGLEAHDPGSHERPLEPGVVLTVEPGIYIAGENLGVRIEDDVVITAEGAEVLSDVPKEIREIERLLAAPRKKISL
jgi:Xaa-Pro aminopeptidase